MRHALKHNTIGRTLTAIGLVAGLAYGANHLLDNSFSFVPDASAQQGQGQGGPSDQAGSGGQGGGAGGGNGNGRAGDELEELLRGYGKIGAAASEEEDSDRPVWAQGNRDLNPHAQGGGQPSEAGSKKGDLYGDLYVILRDENGVPILLTLPSGEQVVQPVDADGNIIPLNDEGEPVDEAAAALLQTVEFSRLSVGRSPNKVTDQALEEALLTLSSIYTLNEDHEIVIADGAVISYDAAGRLLITVDGETQAIDSPLSNLALYTELMTTGSLSTVVTLSYKDDSNQTVYVTKEVDFVSTLDLDLAAALLAGAADKTSTITIDLVAYQNSIVGVNTVVDGVTTAYFDYSDYTYDRAAEFADATITYLEARTTDTGETIYVPVTKTVLDAVFGGEDGVFDAATENLTASNIAGFTAASDDALQVIEFTHDNQVPETL